MKDIPFKTLYSTIRIEQMIDGILFSLLKFIVK